MRLKFSLILFSSNKKEDRFKGLVMLNSFSALQLDYIRLWFLVQHSLSSFNKIRQYYPSLKHAFNADQYATWEKLGIHKNHLQRFQNFQSEAEQQKFQHCLCQIEQYSDF